MQKQAEVQKPEMYYLAITKMTNKALGIESGQREIWIDKLQLLKLAETLVEIAIRDGLKAKLDYKIFIFL